MVEPTRILTTVKRARILTTVEPARIPTMVEPAALQLTQKLIFEKKWKH